MAQRTVSGQVTDAESGEDVTTSISRIDPSNISVAAKSNINDMLFGLAAGLKVTQESSQPGGGVDISIRGRGNPLIHCRWSGRDIYLIARNNEKNCVL